MALKGVVDLGLVPNVSQAALATIGLALLCSRAFWTFIFMI